MIQVIRFTTGTDSLTGKEDQDGVIATFEDGSLTNSFLSWKSLQQLGKLKQAELDKKNGQS